MRNLHRNNKGVSPVIATVLMILITMIGMTILFAFVAAYADNYQKGLGGSVLESLVFEDIWLNPNGNTYANGKIQISVYNAGKVDSVVTAVYVNGLKLTDGSNNFNFNLVIKQGENRLLQLTHWSGNGPSIWVSGEYYEFRIATKMGSTFDSKPYQAP
jgi:flagellin-like protein